MKIDTLKLALLKLIEEEGMEFSYKQLSICRIYRRFGKPLYQVHKNNGFSQVYSDPQQAVEEFVKRKLRYK